MVYSDSHVHLDSFPQEDLDIALADMKAKKVELVLNVSINLATSAESIKLAQTYPNILAAVGIHPGETIPLTDDVKKRLEELSGQKIVAAFGEIGIAYGPMAGDNKEMQKELFSFQLSLANNIHVPIDIHHSNDAHDDLINIIKKQKGSMGIVHGFNGTMEELNDWLNIGFYISLGMNMVEEPHGPMPMPPVEEAVVRAIPDDRLITETDSMARMSVSRWKVLGGPRGAPKGPEPSKGMPPQPPQEIFHQPSDVVRVVAKIASIRGVPAEEIAGTATANLKRLLKVK